jgi:hypothetical protein
VTEQIKKQPLLSGLLILFLVAMIFANIGRSMYQPLLPLYVKDLGASIRQIGLFFTLAQIVPLFLQILRGAAFGLFGTSLGLVSLPAPWIGAQLWARVSPQFPFLVTAIILLLAVIPIWLKFKLPKVLENTNVTSDEAAVVTTA